MKENTKSLIADTFSQMLDKEDLDKITVTKLIGECHISRQTFYYHFKDIMDVLEWTFRRATEELAQKSLEAESRTETLTAYIAFVSENKRKLEKLIDSRKWAQIEEMLLGSVTIYLAEMARNKYSDVDISFDDMEVMLRFYASGNHRNFTALYRQASSQRSETGQTNGKDNYRKYVSRKIQLNF